MHEWGCLLVKVQNGDLISREYAKYGSDEYTSYRALCDACSDWGFKTPHYFGGIHVDYDIDDLVGASSTVYLFYENGFEKEAIDEMRGLISVVQAQFIKARSNINQMYELLYHTESLKPIKD